MLLDQTASREKKIFVAMSGGVDSSVVAGILKEGGQTVVGVTMCFSISHPDSRKPSCCGVDGIEDARRSAQILGVPHYVLDFAQDIQDLIIADFTSEYAGGRTPNPCVRCNQFLKFGTLYKRVMNLGAAALATGHYARIEYDAAAGCYQLKKAVDERKDQSYFLWGLQRELLPTLLFPLGGLRKDEVRAIARRYHLNTAQKAESQDICFVPAGGYKQFLRDRMPEGAFLPGDFRNAEGEVVGRHQGIANYTIGQRDQLGIALGRPVYVYRIDRDTNTVYVGDERHLYASGLLAGGFNALSPRVDTGEHAVTARIRYNAPEVAARLTVLGEGRVRADFDQPQKSVTPGQSVVFYDGEVVLGGAVIDRPLP